MLRLLIFSCSRLSREFVLHTLQNQLSPTDNPVCKVPLVICGHGGQLIVEELFDEGAPTRVAPAHDDSFSATPEVLTNRRRSRQMSEI